MTVDLNQYYRVTVHHGEKEGPRKWIATGEIFRRDTDEHVATVYGEGGAMTSADSRAIAEARQRVAQLGRPAGWKAKGIEL